MDIQLFFIELTCPCQKNIEYDHVYKQEKYSLLVADLSQKHQMFQFSVYVSARGSISEETQARFKAITLKSCDDSNVESQKVMNMCSKAATCFSIFSTRNEPFWLSSRHKESIGRLYQIQQMSTRLGNTGEFIKGKQINIRD